MSDTESRKAAKEPDLKKAYGYICRRLRYALYRYNPLRTGRENKVFLYRPIMGTILPRCEGVKSPEELEQIIREELVSWCRPMYGSEVVARMKLEKLARSVWVGIQNDSTEVSGTRQTLESSLEEDRQPHHLYARLFYEVLSVLHQNDPMGIAYVPDEHTPEVGTIIPRLEEARSARELQRIVHKEFAHWFQPATIGPEAEYERIAEEIWAAWQRYSFATQGIQSS